MDNVKLILFHIAVKQYILDGGADLGTMPQTATRLKTVCVSSG